MHSCVCKSHIAHQCVFMRFLRSVSSESFHFRRPSWPHPQSIKLTPLRGHCWSYSTIHDATPGCKRDHKCPATWLAPRERAECFDWHEQKLVTPYCERFLWLGTWKHRKVWHTHTFGGACTGHQNWHGPCHFALGQYMITQQGNQCDKYIDGLLCTQCRLSFQHPQAGQDNDQDPTRIQIAPIQTPPQPF